MLNLYATRQFKKDFVKIPDFTKKQSEIIAFTLRKNPVEKSLDIKKLKGVNPIVWRVRAGSYRLIYNFNKTSITLLRVCHRKDVYKKFQQAR